MPHRSQGEAGDQYARAASRQPNFDENKVGQQNLYSAIPGLVKRSIKVNVKIISPHN